MVCDQSDSLATETVAGRSRRQEKETSGAMQSTLLMRGLDGKNLIVKQRSFDLFLCLAVEICFCKNHNRSFVSLVQRRGISGEVLAGTEIIINNGICKEKNHKTHQELCQTSSQYRLSCFVDSFSTWSVNVGFVLEVTLSV